MFETNTCQAYDIESWLRTLFIRTVQVASRQHFDTQPEEKRTHLVLLITVIEWRETIAAKGLGNVHTAAYLVRTYALQNCT